MGFQINQTNLYEQNQKTAQTGGTKKQDEIGQCYNELCKYSAPSMDNICSIWNAGYKQDGNNFYAQHMGYCDEYGDAAKNYGDAVLKGSEDLDKLVENIKTVTQKSVAGLKSLIVQENSFINEKHINQQDNNDNEFANNTFANFTNKKEEPSNNFFAKFTKVFA